MNVDSSSRKWQLTINNPEKHGWTHEYIRLALGSMSSIVYWCMCDEVGVEEETYHTHVYLYSKSAVRFSTLKKRFPTAHFEMARGTSQQNRDYIFKEGEHEKSKKKEGNKPETREEYGQMPVERQGARNDLADLLDSIMEGDSNFKIITENPNMMFAIDKIERVRQTILETTYKNKRRTDMEVTYIYGATGTGKTRFVMDKYGDENVFRVVDYLHPFDSYRQQDVVLFEEFNSSIPIQQMLLLLDVYPLELACRYANKIACYTKVYITSNISLVEQYKGIQEKYDEVWKALLRRVHKIREHSYKGVVEYSVEQMLNEIERISIFPS